MGFRAVQGTWRQPQRKVVTLALNLTVTPQIPIPGRQFCATQAYDGSRPDELSVPSGACVNVLEISDRGWWLCRYSEVCVCVLEQWQAPPGGTGT